MDTKNMPKVKQKDLALYSDEGLELIGEAWLREYEKQLAVCDEIRERLMLVKAEAIDRITPKGAS